MAMGWLSPRLPKLHLENSSKKKGTSVPRLDFAKCGEEHPRIRRSKSKS